MVENNPVLRPEQWEFLAVFDALGFPMAVDLVGELVPLSPGPFLEVLRQARTAGWLKQTAPDTYRLASDLPRSVERRLETINNPDHISSLLERIDQLGLRDRFHPACLSRLFSRTGNLYESAMALNESAKQALESGDLNKASSHFDEIISMLDGVEGAQEQRALFINTALSLSNLRLRLGRRIGEVPELLQRAGRAADRMGDRRSRALIDLHFGRFSYVSDNLSDAISSLVSGLDEVEELGDEDILGQSAEFVGLYYFLQGMYKDAIQHFDRAMLSAESRKVDVDNFFLPYTFGYCAAYLGQFHRAVGVLDYNWRRYHKKSEAGLAFLFRSALGIVLLMMGKRSKALYHLQGVLEESHGDHSPQYILMTRLGVAYYYFLEGRMEESAEMMLHGTDEAARVGYRVRHYTFPFALEMISEFRSLDIEGQQEDFRFDQEMEKFIQGPNVHLRGVGYRIRAMEALRKGDAPERIGSDLEMSERYLEKAGDPIELSKTRDQMARLKLRAGNPEKASIPALSAPQEISADDGTGFSQDPFPFLEHMTTRTDRSGFQADVLKRFLDLMEEFVPSADLDEILGRVVATSAKFHGAERGGLFWFKGLKGGRVPKLRVGYNLSRDQVSAVEFRSSLRHIIKAFRTNQALLCRLEREAGETAIRPHVALCLPFEVRGRVRGVLYHDNTYADNRFNDLDGAMLIRITRQMSAYIERIWEYSRLAERKTLRIQSASARIEGATHPMIVGESPVMLRLLDLVDQVADSEASVLILGETGVGKELLAQRIHQTSPRESGPFVTVDLSAIPETLIESELFGHEKGAFTGADRQKPGRLELAHQGTLFIDEVGEIPVHLQTKLLRVLQEKTFVRIGASRPLSSDFRLLAATNRDLEVEVAEGRFRKDLYYRLNVIPLRVPPLRERGRDVALLAKHFLDHYGRKHNRPDIQLSSEEKEELLAYRWPGNVRELKNIIERAVLLAEEQVIGLNLPNKTEPLSNHPFDAMPTMEDLQRRYIKFVLERTGGRIGGPGGAAEILGMKRTTLYTRMKKLKMG